MEECVFFFGHLFALLFVVLFFLCIISPAYGLLLYKASVPNQYSAFFSPSTRFAMVSCTYLSPFSQIQRQNENGIDERRQMTMSRPFSSSRSPGSPDRGFFDF